MTDVTSLPRSLTSNSRRLVIYAISDIRGDVDDYIPHALIGLRPHAERIIAVVDGVLSDAGRSALAPVVDRIIERERIPFALWAYKAAIDELEDELAAYDEVVFTSDTWFGPIHPFGPVFERMDVAALDFWGMTDHGEETPNPYTQDGSLAAHVQSHWFAARARVISSDAWSEYWAGVDVDANHAAMALQIETDLTVHFRDAGFVDAVAFSAADYPTTDPSLFNAELLLAAGCPLLRRRPFADWPPYLDHHAVVGKWTLQAVDAAGFPMSLILQSLARNVPPKVLNTDAAMLEVLPEVGVSYDDSQPLRVAVVAHIFYEELTDELLDHADTLPVPYDLIVTTPDAQKAATIREIVARRETPPLSFDVRVVESNDGRDLSALLVGCRDVLLDPSHDLVVKIHSKKSPQDGYNNGEHFRDQQLKNLLNSPGYTANLLALFQREAGLGLVFPPMVHIGAATMGRGWAVNKDGFARWAEELRIRVPLDDVSPLAPFGSMYVARPEALRLMAEREWAYSEFGNSADYRDGSLAHILERMPAYACGELGYHTRTVANSEYISTSHTALDFKLDQISATTAGYPNEQIEFLRRAGFMGDGKFADIAMMYIRLRHPKLDRRLQETSWFGKLSALRSKTEEPENGSR